MFGYYVALGAVVLFFWLKKTHRKQDIELPPLRRDVCTQTDDLIMRTLPDSPLSQMSMESGDEMLIESFFDPEMKRD